MSDTTPNLAGKIPVVAIVGRPNVGKSSLFNAIIGRRMSIVHEMSGVTRDRVMAPATFHGRHFELIDTGGLGVFRGERGSDMWDGFISAQAGSAIADADVLICVGNVQDGVTSLDREVVKFLRGCGKPVVYAVNKSDNPELAMQAVEFSELGYDDVIPISCLHRTRIEEVVATALDKLPEAMRNFSPPDGKAKRFGIAVVGRPNVGKSSLTNALLGEDRLIVSDVAGTTRDAVDIDFDIERDGEKIPALLVDTAGLRKKAKVDTVVEYFSVMRANEAIRRADLVLFVVESSPDGVTSQDRKIAGLIEEAGKATIIVANKYDLQRGESGKSELIDELRYTLPGMDFAPICFVSALEKTGLKELLHTVLAVKELSEMSIGTGILNRVLGEAFERVTPPVIGNAPLKFYYALMTGNAPPSFILFVNQPKYCAPNYLGYLKKSLRRAFDFTGLPIRIDLRARPKKVEGFHTASRSEKPTHRKGGATQKPAKFIPGRSKSTFRSDSSRKNGATGKKR